MPEIFALSPTLFFTMKGNLASENVLENLKRIVEEKKVLCIVCDDEDGARNIVKTHTPQRSVVLFDNEGPNRRKHFTMRCFENENHKKKRPAWAENALWGVEITPKKCNRAHCARLLNGVFIKHFIYDPLHRKLPWGNKRKEKEKTERKRRERTKKDVLSFVGC